MTQTEPTPDAQYLITKRGVYYRPNAQGYTPNKWEAGRFTLAKAISHSHPNGPDGPRDGIDYELAPTPDAGLVDRVARAIFESPSFGAWVNQGPKPQWADGGNSDMQMLARLFASAAISAIPVDGVQENVAVAWNQGYRHAAEKFGAQLAAKDAEIAELRKWRTEQDCRYTMGRVADISGSHCPLDDPCERCAKDAENARLRQALEQIARFEEGIGRFWRDIARAALKGPCDV